MEENKERQIEEIEALTSIYEDKFELEDEQHFSVKLEENPGEVVILSVELDPQYPASSPPTFTLSAPFLTSQHKQQLTGRLEEVYLENLGECIVFLWIEEIRQFLQSFKPEDTGGGISEESGEAEQLLSHLIISNSESDETKSTPCPEIYTTDVFEDRKSIFQGHCASVSSMDQVKSVINKLYENKKIANATHNMYAYRIFCQDKNSWLQDCDDDGETAAGGRMLHLLEIVDATNAIVVVSRWYGGIHLGPDRFKHINNMTRRALVESGFVKASETTTAKKKKR